MGESEAFSRLFQIHQPRLLYYVRRLLGSQADAEDLLQEVWITVVRKLSSLEEPTSFRSWLYRIAHNRSISVLRKKNLEIPLDETADEIAFVDSGKDAEIFREQDIDAMHVGLQRLSAAHREVLTLQFLMGLSYEEIADAIGCNIGTVRSRIYYGKKALRAEIDAQRQGVEN